MLARAHGDDRPTKWATFWLGRELMGLPVEEVQEVVLAQPLTPIPLAPPRFLGLLNLRGQVMPVVDLGPWMDPPRVASTDGKLLVVRVGGELLSLQVDDVGDVLDLPASGWRAPPETVPLRHRQSVDGIYPLEGRVLLALKLDALMADDLRTVSA